MDSLVERLGGRLAACMLAAALGFAVFVPTADAAERQLTDLPDEVSGLQVHFVYVIPNDGVDRALDTNGVIANEVDVFQRWLERETAGRRLRVDTAGGELDISFFRLSRTDAEIAAHGPFVRDEIEVELTAAGFSAPGKIYGVYYDGSSTFACGGGAWPPTLPGTVAALYLRGEPPGAPPCSTNPFASPGGSPGYLQYAMLHEIFHTMGIVPTCAPHHTRAGHVSDSPTDLMYAGDEPWTPSTLDVGRDDYFDAQIPGCQDLTTNGWLTDRLPDTTAPTVTCSAGPGTLKSNNHKLVSITTSVTVTDETGGSGAAGFTLVSVHSSQADSGLTGGDLSNDIQDWTIGTADTSGLLRAERYGGDRVYTLTYQGSDVAGNTATCQTTVRVKKGN